MSNAFLHPSWETRSTQAKLATDIANEFKLLPVTANLLIQRGLENFDDIRAYLQPSLKHLLHPESMHALDTAARRIVQSLQNNETVLVHGDFDVDGITSTALLYRFFCQLGLKVETYIPNRLEENHGIHERAIAMAKDKQVKLFITCDCGISSSREIDELHASGIETIVTDHHQEPAEGAPKNAIVVNPSQKACSFADRDMSGVGIAFYLLIAVRSKLRQENFFEGDKVEPNLRSYLDLVALGTVADVAPLKGQNRILVCLGLQELRSTEKMGLRVLTNLCLPADQKLTVEDIAFQIAPKLNAAGRLGKADEAFALLVEEDPVAAAVLARKMINYNDERKEIEQKVLQQATHQAARIALDGAPSALVLYEPTWHLGVIGIVANRLVERFGCPVMLLTSHQSGQLKGSGRSPKYVHLADSLEQLSDLLTTYGGHAKAAGMMLESDKFESFKAQFSEICAQARASAPPQKVEVDGLIELGDIQPRLADELSLLRPFGEGNPEPMFICTEVTGVEVKTMGDRRQHLRLTLQDSNGSRLPAIGFGLGEYAKRLTQPFSALITPEYNVWKGRKTLRARLHAIHLAP